jgi:hypothetical protein
MPQSVRMTQFVLRLKQNLPPHPAHTLLLHYKLKETNNLLIHDQNYQKLPHIPTYFESFKAGI